MRFVMDSDGDIGLTFWNIVTFIKYKNSVLVYWFRCFETAPKHVRGV